MHTIEFDKPTEINQFMIMEDYRQGHRIREFVVEGRTADGQWIEINRGTAVGRKRIVMFEPVEVTRLTLRITRQRQRADRPRLQGLLRRGRQSLSLRIEEPNALSQGAKATASDEHSAPYVAGKICDGNAGTWWGVSDASHSRPTSVGSNWTSAGSAPSTRRPSTNRGTERRSSSWSIAATQTRTGRSPSRAPRWARATSRKFEPVTGRYWRLHTLKANHYPSIKEWQLFGPGTGGAWQKCGSVGPDAFTDGEARIELDISKFIDAARAIRAAV